MLCGRWCMLSGSLTHITLDHSITRPLTRSLDHSITHALSGGALDASIVRSRNKAVSCFTRLTRNSKPAPRTGNTLSGRRCQGGALACGASSSAGFKAVTKASNSNLTPCPRPTRAEF
eukprot:927203-Rhodomonas_salina.1